MDSSQAAFGAELQCAARRDPAAAGAGSGSRGVLAPSAQLSSSLMNTLSDHSRSRRSAAKARRVFVRHVQVSVLVACWTVMLAMPVIIWPLQEQLWNFGCAHRPLLECVLQDGCTWAFSPQTFRFKCRTFRSGYLSLWGTMIMQFVFSMYSDLGSTVKLTIQGAFGTFCACANMLLLNGVLGFWLRGGAAQNPLHVQRTSSVNSRWLPLCNDGFNVLVEGPCFLNVAWSLMSTPETLKFCFTMLDFVVFVVLCLTVGFDTNTRMFALSSHVYFMMSFLNPTSHDFTSVPDLSHHYGVMIAFASLVSVLSFLFPRKRFTAARAAASLEEEAAHAVKALLASLASAGAAVSRQRAANALAETYVVLDELDATLASSWFEDFGRGEDAQARRRARSFACCLRSCIERLPCVHDAASALAPTDVEALQQQQCAGPLSACASAAGALVEAASLAAGGTADAAAQLDAASKALAAALPLLRPALSDASCVLLFALQGAFKDVRRAALEHEQELERLQQRRHQRGCVRRFFRSVVSHFGVSLLERSATHPRFVVRNTLSICLAFFLGLLGLWNVLPAYSSYPASTICVIVYTYTGSSTAITTKRVAGVVLGKVTGTALQLYFAVKSVWKASMYAASLWIVVALTFFMYQHSDKDLGYVCCLVSSYAASSMIPANFQFRDSDATDFADVTPGLLNTIVATVIGVAILSIVDFSLASKATHQARQLLLRSMRRTKRFLLIALHPHEGRYREDVYSDLDALIAVIPHALTEPVWWRAPFPADFYGALERHLRKVCSLVDTLRWVWDSAQSPSADGAGKEVSQLPPEAYWPLLGCFEHEAAGMLSDILALTASLTEDSEREADTAKQVRQELQSTLYSARAVGLVASGISGVVDVARGRSARNVRSASKEAGFPSTSSLLSSSTSTATASAAQRPMLPEAARDEEVADAAGARERPDTSRSRPGGVGTLWRSIRRPCERLRAAAARCLEPFVEQVVHEQLSADATQTFTGTAAHSELAPGSRFGAPAAGETVDVALDRLRRDCRRSSSDPPACSDDHCRVEFMAFLIKSVFAELEKIQLVLLDF